MVSIPPKQPILDLQGRNIRMRAAASAGRWLLEDASPTSSSYCNT
jgi:hypothetical protein